MAPARQRRRFTRFDASALALATVLGLAMTKPIFDGYEFLAMVDDGRHVPRGFRYWNPPTALLFVSWSLTLLALRFRGYPARRVMRGPGTATGVVVALFTARALVEWAVGRLRWNWQQGSWSWGGLGILEGIPIYLTFMTEFAGFAVAGTWLALWAGRWWHPAPDWIDRAGRVLGGYWVAVFLVELYRRLD